jgi:hypothetical protein
MLVEVLVMRTRIKPVEPTVIRDKKIIADVIREIRRKPTERDKKIAAEEEGIFLQLTRRRG